MKILLIKRGAIGDLLMATPLIRQLKTKVNCTLDVVVGASSSGAIKDNKYIDNLYTLPDKYLTIVGFLHFFSFLWKRRKQYDCVFVLDKHYYFNIMAKILGAKTIGYARDKLSRFILDKHVIYNDVTRYHGLYYLDLLLISELAITNYNDYQLDLVINNTAKAQLEQLLSVNCIDDFVVVVNSGGNNSYETSGIRMLPQDKIIQLLQSLLIAGHTVVLLGGEVDNANYTAYCSIIASGKLINFAGKLNLAQSAYMIKKSEHFYTTDCGAMHLGVAMQMNNKMTVFFGPSNPAHVLPQSYLAYSAIWSDMAVYEKIYPLRGVITNKDIKYFTKLNIIDHIFGSFKN